MAFTTLMLFQLFNVFNARSDDDECVSRPVHEPVAVGSAGSSLALQVVVIYTPFLQQAFSTTGLRSAIGCGAGVASSVLWLRELNQAVERAMRPGPDIAEALLGFEPLPVDDSGGEAPRSRRRGPQSARPNSN